MKTRGPVLTAPRGTPNLHIPSALQADCSFQRTWHLQETYQMQTVQITSTDQTLHPGDPGTVGNPAKGNPLRGRPLTLYTFLGEQRSGKRKGSHREGRTENLCGLQVRIPGGPERKDGAEPVPGEISLGLPCSVVRAAPR